jgi:hypothetical protein
MEDLGEDFEPTSSRKRRPRLSLEENQKKEFMYLWNKHSLSERERAPILTDLNSSISRFQTRIGPSASSPVDCCITIIFCVHSLRAHQVLPWSNSYFLCSVERTLWTKFGIASLSLFWDCTAYFLPRYALKLQQAKEL